MDNIEDKIKARIKHKLASLNIDILQYKLKNDLDVSEFTPNIITFVNELWNEIKNKRSNLTKYQIYSWIARCFIDQGHEIHNYWICSECGNRNHPRFIGNKLNYDLSICTLCGIKQIDSIIMKIQNRDSFRSIIEITNMTASEVKEDDVQLLIQKEINNNSFRLQCPLKKDDNDQDPCSSVIKLAHYLIVYNQWLNRIYDKDESNQDIDTVSFDIETLINKEIRSCIIESAKSMGHNSITSKDLSSLEIVLDDEKNASELKASLRQKSTKNCGEFVSFIADNIDASHDIIEQLYRSTYVKLQSTAHMNKFGECLSDLDARNVQELYQHVLDIHINNGNEQSIKNTFQFFANIVHCQGKAVDCKSCQRIETRVNRSITPDKNTMKHENILSSSYHQNKDIFNLKESYKQSQLDIIHQYLVHSDWQKAVQTYLYEQGDIKQESYEISQYPTPTPAITSNSDKFNTDANSYGFGIDHGHPKLSNKFDSVYHELTKNSFCAIGDDTFSDLMVKATDIHERELRNNEHNLKCKYYDEEYGLVRNDPIGIQHIFSLITYTDLTKFCTAFRRTYRLSSATDTKENVIKNHCELYFYARYLYEAIEFYGTEMGPNEEVYHGLSVKLHFRDFTAYFNQPISTTTDFGAARQFGSDGIILTFKAVPDSDKVSKYLAVDWLSNFPHEKEKLFYGSSIRFAIDNITDGYTLKSHKPELSAFNQFQRLLENQSVEWKLMDNLIIRTYIKYQRYRNFRQDEQKDDDDEIPSLLQECTAKDIVHIIKSYARFSQKNITGINRFRGKILDFIVNEDMNGTRLLQIKKDEFIAKMQKSQNMTENPTQSEENKDDEKEMNKENNGAKELYIIANQVYEEITTFNLASEFGCYLFKHFCNHHDRKHIAIQRFDHLPLEICNVLFIDGNKDEKVFSILPVIELFPYLEEININDIKYMERYIESYIDAVVTYINITSNSKSKETNLRKIIFQSNKQLGTKKNSHLENIKMKYSKQHFNHTKWNIEYIISLFDNSSAHSIVIRDINGIFRVMYQT